MSRPDLLHPRLSVVPVDGRARPAVGAAPGRTVVGPAELAGAMAAVADRRRTRLRERIAEMESTLRGEEVRLAEADAAADQRRADRDAFLAAAAWCESLPDQVVHAEAGVAAAEAELADRLRASRDAARALDRVLDQRASADAAIAEARRQLAALRDGGAEREQAAADLAAQAAAVEVRLTEAEADARARSEHTKRAVGACERELERLAREQRDQHGRLGELVSCLPKEARPPVGDEAIAHVAGIAAGLRELAGVVDAELTGLQAAADRQRAACDGQRHQVEAAAAALDRIAPEDAAEALADLVSDAVDGLLVLDDVVATDHAGAHDGLLRALETAEPSTRLVLLSSDPAVLGWAIDLPADRGALVGPRTVDLLTEQPTTTTAVAGPTRVLPRQHVTTAPGEHQ